VKDGKEQETKLKQREFKMNDGFESNLEKQINIIIKVNEKFILKYTLYSIILFLGISYILYRTIL
jgi:hypothetical protein